MMFMRDSGCELRGALGDHSAEEKGCHQKCCSFQNRRPDIVGNLRKGGDLHHYILESGSIAAAHHAAVVTVLRCDMQTFGVQGLATAQIQAMHEGLIPRRATIDRVAWR